MPRPKPRANLMVAPLAGLDPVRESGTSAPSRAPQLPKALPPDERLRALAGEVRPGLVDGGGTVSIAAEPARHRACWRSTAGIALRPRHARLERNGLGAVSPGYCRGGPHSSRPAPFLDAARPGDAASAMRGLPADGIGAGLSRTLMPMLRPCEAVRSDDGTQRSGHSALLVGVAGAFRSSRSRTVAPSVVARRRMSGATELRFVALGVRSISERRDACRGPSGG